jgi:hypothetical protein
MLVNILQLAWKRVSNIEKLGKIQTCIKMPRKLYNISHVLPQYKSCDFVTYFKEVCNIEKS